jgi:hypothetical protein
MAALGGKLPVCFLAVGERSGRSAVGVDWPKADWHLRASNASDRTPFWRKHFYGGGGEVGLKRGSPRECCSCPRAMRNWFALMNLPI